LSFQLTIQDVVDCLRRDPVSVGCRAHGGARVLLQVGKGAPYAFTGFDENPDEAPKVFVSGGRVGGGGADGAPFAVFGFVDCEAVHGVTG
jgi:hypothetical protein